MDGHAEHLHVWVSHGLGKRFLDKFVPGFRKFQRGFEDRKIKAAEAFITQEVRLVDSVRGQRKAIEEGAQSAHFPIKLSYRERAGIEAVRHAFATGQLKAKEDQTFEDFIAQVRTYAERAQGQKERLLRAVSV